jgi:enoyl-CoA hydratase/carnithine racemase
MADQKVKLEFDGRVAVVSFNRPERHNAVDDETAQLFASILRELHSRADLGAVVLRGEGASFSSGRDTQVLGHRSDGQDDLTFVADAQANTGLISSMPVPVVAALRGWVIGAGFERALHCDVRIATPDTRMSLPEVSYGLVPDTGGVARLFALAGPAVTKDVVLTGRILSAGEALSLGIVTRIVESDELDTTALQMARAVAAAPPIAVKLARNIIDELWRDRAERSVRQELLSQVACFASEDYQEAKAARREGRPPSFTGR